MDQAEFKERAPEKGSLKIYVAEMPTTDIFQRLDCEGIPGFGLGSVESQNGSIAREFQGSVGKSRVKSRLYESYYCTTTIVQKLAFIIMIEFQNLFR